MRRFFHLLGTLISVLLALGGGLFLYAAWHASVLGQGISYTYYLGADSSSPSVTATSPYVKLFLAGVQGESVQYEGDCYESLADKYNAELLFTEETEGVTSYYLYSPMFSSRVILNGYAVNLHIAVSKERTTAGTPLIFGSF